MDLSCSFLALVSIFVAIYWLSTRKFSHWNKQNLPCVPNPFPGFGHILPIITLKESLPAFIYRIYKTTNTSMIGFYFLRTPAIVVRDPELVRSVLQTNFTSFCDNNIGLKAKSDPIASKHPFFVTDPHVWKKSRIQSVNHLSGNKLRYLFIIAKEVCSRMNDYIDRKIKTNNGFYECELKDHFTKYTGELVANTAFAIQGQSFEDRPDQLSFTNVAKTTIEPTLFNCMKQVLVYYLPDIANFFGVSFMGKKTDTYFRENLRATIKQRKQMSNTPNDFLQLCINSNPEDDIDNIIADIMVFYIEAYDTSSTAMSLLFYNLSRNIQIQEKLHDHILTTLKATNGVVTYDSLKNMNYLDQVVFETMRITAPSGVQMKVCTKEITLKGSDNLTCHLQPGNRVFISTIGLHLDSKYWANPHIFDPERFSRENQTDRNKDTFIPFGEGPRMCLGMRLGLMLVKLVTVEILTRYYIEHSTKTKLPLELEAAPFLTYFKGGVWAKFKNWNRYNNY